MEKKTTLGDIMWFDILKDSKQINRTVSSLNWDEEEIPEQDKDDCLEELEKILKRALDGPPYHSKRYEVKVGYKINDDAKMDIKGIPNEVACFFLDKIKQLDFSIRKDGHSLLTGGFKGNFGDYYIYAGINKTVPHLRGNFGPHSEENHISSVFYIEDKKGQRPFRLRINWLFTEEIEEKGSRSKNYSVYEKEYSDICKRILGV
tara:strand:- start:133 stop:744 length:612 start_codon:yes stop_codon:yes gene_type:complete